MKRLVYAVIGLLIVGSLVSAATMPITLQWAPDPANTVPADTYVVTRQSGGAGAWQEVCRIPATQTTCQDTQVPAGQSCWKGQALAGTLAVDSQPTCRTLQQFVGTLTVIVGP